MLTKIRSHASFSNVVALTALFVALGGTSYAATTIGSKQIKNNSVRGVDIKNRTIKSKDIAKGVIGATLQSTAAQASATRAHERRRVGRPTHRSQRWAGSSPGAYVLLAKVNQGAERAHRGPLPHPGRGRLRRLEPRPAPAGHAGGPQPAARPQLRQDRNGGACLPLGGRTCRAHRTRSSSRSRSARPARAWSAANRLTCARRSAIAAHTNSRHESTGHGSNRLRRPATGGAIGRRRARRALPGARPPTGAGSRAAGLRGPRGQRAAAVEPAGSGHGRRRRLLPRALDGPRRPATTTAPRIARVRPLSRRWRAARESTGSSTWAASATTRAPSTCAAATRRPRR